MSATPSVLPFFLPPCVLFAANFILLRVFLDFCLVVISSEEAFGKSFKPICRGSFFFFFGYMYKYWSRNLHQVEPPPPSFNSKRIIVAVLRLTLFCISTVCWFFFFPQRPQLRNLSRSEQTSHQERWQLRKSSRTLRFWNDLDFVPCLLDSLNLNIARTHLYHATWSSLSPTGLGECFVVVWNWHPLKNKRCLT